MSGGRDERLAGRAARPAASRQGLIHFAVAAAILGIAAGGWSVAVEVLRIAVRKKAVPWPAGVEVDEEFRMVSLPGRLGPYQFVDKDGEIARDDRGLPKKDGRPDGEIEIPDDLMEQLKIGTGTDETNRPERRSNWFVARFYRDARVPPNRPLRYWRLETYYYTGGVDVVPHVPEICLVAGGARLVSRRDMAVSVPSAPGEWGSRPVKLRRILFERSDYQGQTLQYAQYYVFSLNGEPETSREVVRLKLTSPFVRHAYFAKIQFGSLTPVFDPVRADEAARDFARHFLPHVLKVLPMPEEIEKLESGG